MAVPRTTMSARIREAGGYYDNRAKLWILNAVAGFPKATFAKIEDAFAEAVQRRVAVQRESPIGPIYATRYHY